MIERALSKTDIRTLLDRLSERLREKRAFAKLHVVGSACIALAYERERTTLDIDVRVDAGHRALEDAIREIAQERGLPQRWLNDQARGFIPERDDPRSPRDHPEERSGPPITTTHARRRRRRAGARANTRVGASASA